MLLPARRKGRNNKGGDRRNEMTMQERYQDVKDFWLKQSPARQKELLRVPIRLLLQGWTDTPLPTAGIPTVYWRLYCHVSSV